MASTKFAQFKPYPTTGYPEIVEHSLGPDCPLRNAVLVLGNFDGFHVGHQALVCMAHGIAKGLPVAVMSCEPHPRSFFGAGDRPFRLATPACKQLLFGQYRVDFIFSPKFDRAFAALDPSEFVQTFLIEALGVSHVIAGPDFRFGCRRSGDMSLLSNLCSVKGVGVSVAPDIKHAGVRVSSTLIRTAIEEGDLHGAAQLLGCGWVVEIERHSDGGIALHRDLCRPRAGHYLARPRGPVSWGENVLINITETGEFVPLGPHRISDVPELWLIERPHRRVGNAAS